MDRKRQKLTLEKVIAELKQVKEERARSELESKIDKYKEQCTKLQSENEKLQSENEKLQSENEKLQRENEKLLKYLQDLESANINVEEKNQITLTHNTDLNSQITKLALKSKNMVVYKLLGHTVSCFKHEENDRHTEDYKMIAAEYMVMNSRYPQTPNMNPPPGTSRDYAYGPYLLAPNNPYPLSTSAYPCSSNRHYPATNSSYSGPTSMNQPPGASPYPLMRFRCYDSRFGPSVNETNDDALNINSLSNEIILKVFSYLTQNQLGQIARVCRRWNVLTKSPVLWKKVNVKFFSPHREKNTVVKSFINGLPSCVTFIKLDFQKFELPNDFQNIFRMDFEELCMKLHQNCPNVEELILLHLGMSYLLPEVINYCTQFLQCVKKLVFCYCRFSKSFRTVELNDNSKIEVLDVNCCDISPFNKTQFSKLLCLKELHLSVTRVDTWFEDNTSFLNKLHVLDMRHTLITASTFLAIQNHAHNLKELYLCWFKLKARHLTFTDSVFPYLKTICLSDRHVACDAVVSLIQSCPSLENVYVAEHVAESFAAHPFVLGNRCKSGIVKAIVWIHDHNADYSHN